MREFEILAQHLFLCAPSVAQHAALACFTPSTLKILERRRIEFESEGVAATPGLDFGSNATRGYVRFAYIRSMADLEEATKRLRRFCGRKSSRRSAS